jgi:virginiamycin B lyase
MKLLSLLLLMAVSFSPTGVYADVSAHAGFFAASPTDRVAEASAPLLALLDDEFVRINRPSYVITETPTSGLLDDRIRPTKIWDPHINDVSDADIFGRKLMARAPDGNIWFTRTQGDSIGRIPAVISGPVIRSPNGGYPSEQFFPLGRTDAGLQDITIAPDGTAWFTERWASRVGHLRSDNHIEEFATPTPNARPVGIAVGADGKIYFGETGFPANFASVWNTSPRKLGCLDPATGTITEVTLPDPHGFASRVGAPKSFVSGPDGNVWFTAGSALVRVTPSLELTWFSVAYGGFEVFPWDLTVGADGALWFTVHPYYQGQYHVGRMTTGGSVSWINTPKPALTIAAGPDGNIWFTTVPFEDLIGGPATLPFVGRIKIGEPGFPVSAFELPSEINGGRTSNVALGLVGGAPSNDSNDWQLFFLEPRANQIGRVHIYRCRDLGQNCGYISDGAVNPSYILCGGTCGAGEVCLSGRCSACTPTTCTAAGAKCGTIHDGCFNYLWCGSCASGQVCNLSLHTCVTPPRPQPSCAAECADDPNPICECECQNARSHIKRRCE